jgi:hypothetical protein
LIEHDLQHARQHGPAIEIEDGQQMPVLLSEARIKPYPGWASTTLGAIFPAPSKKAGGLMALLVAPAVGVLSYVLLRTSRLGARQFGRSAALVLSVAAAAMIIVVPILVDFGVTY